MILYVQDYNDEFEDASSEDLEEGTQIEEDHLDEASRMFLYFMYYS